MSASSVTSKSSNRTAATTASSVSNVLPKYPKKIIILNLSWNTDEKDLFQLFHSFGRVLHVSIGRDREGKSRGFGFVTLQRHEEASEALQVLQGTVLDNMILKLEWVQPRKPNEPQEQKRTKRNGSAKRRKKKANGNPGLPNQKI